MFVKIKKYLSIAICLCFSYSCSDIGRNYIARINFELEGDFGHEYSQLLLYKDNESIKARLETSTLSFHKYDTTVTLLD